MIVYRSARRVIEVQPVLGALPQDPDERLIVLGEVEAGVADALCPDRDDIIPDIASEPDLPKTVEVGVPEGYAYYALYPEAHRMAAKRFHVEVRPDRVVVVGVRSIGAGLSMAVAEELLGAGCEVWRCTVRPRGHPFDRSLLLMDRFERELRQRAAWWFAIVDEGPGISGSSFAGTAAALNRLGVPDERIVFLPSWYTDGAHLRSAAARERWPRHRQYVVPFEETTVGRRFTAARDLSAGCWRKMVLSRGATWPAVHPQHERRKYFVDGRWHRFAGLGSYGREKLRYTSGELTGGFLATDHTCGEPLPGPDPDLRTAVVRHLDSRTGHELPRGASWEELCEMIEVNTREGLGEEALAGLGYLSAHHGAFEAAPACAIDGRLQAHEWLRTGEGYVKTDACDHHADHFFPGPQNISWDVAGAAIELDCDLPGVAVPFFRTAYAAFRLGYATMAAETLGATADGRRFHALSARYAANLRALIASRGDQWHER